ncbi:DNA-binding response regulator [Asaia sp. W19]|uniref:response regulator transcription factor n=1 Tax=unclassified Asaia TaxID=2685023 RepID=UPI000F8D88C2|nr:response regulator transcription factor [Asaia sp. W19]RUT25425.1 DNA-binding response regulator [Asaia sp. W19]
MRLLLVESDKANANALIKTLKQSGITVDHAQTGHEAIDMLRHYDYDLAMTELQLEDLEGYEVIRRARKIQIQTPIIVVSGLTRAQAKIKAFHAGADDYITKPFDTEELVARLQAVVRRSRGYSTAIMTVGPLSIDLNAKAASVDGHPLQLTGKEYAILELLVLRRGNVLTKDAFLNHLYGGIDEPEMKIIDVFICKLRRKLQQFGAGSLIGTVWGRGYVLRDETRVTEPARGAPTGTTDHLHTLLQPSV